jgi:hypothetical protein
VQTQLLIENADLREQARDASTADRTDGDDSWGAWPWKSDFARGSQTLAAPPMNRRKSVQRSRRSMTGGKGTQDQRSTQ